MASDNKILPTLPKNMDFERLYDLYVGLYDDLRTINKPKTTIKQSLPELENDVNLIQKHRINKQSFEVVKLLGKGGYGNVFLCKKMEWNGAKYYAMKCTKKEDISADNGTDGFMAEKEILAYGAKCPYIIQLRHSFQDEINLYYVMDFMQGGDFQNLLWKIDDGINNLTVDISQHENNMRFYAIEIINGINAIHEFGYIHRDIKSANILLDPNGHLKLGDFGTCFKMMGNTNQIKFKTTPGTLDYVCPEVLQFAIERRESCYGPELDWWSFGIMLYEMLVGDTPFYDDDESVTKNRILKHQTELKFPADEDLGFEMSKQYKALVRGFLTSRTKRLGRQGGPKEENNITDIQNMEWFQNKEGWTFENIRNFAPPFASLCSVKDKSDTGNFEELDEENRNNTDNALNFKRMGDQKQHYQGNNLQFVGFSYNTLDDNLLPGRQGKDLEMIKEQTLRRWKNTTKGSVSSTDSNLQEKETQQEEQLQAIMNREQDQQTIEKLKQELESKDSLLINKEVELSQQTKISEKFQKDLEIMIDKREQGKEELQLKLTEIKTLKKRVVRFSILWPAKAQQNRNSGLKSFVSIARTDTGQTSQRHD